MTGFGMEGRVVLVTGGGAGIGAAAVRTFHAAGATVYFTARRDPTEDVPADARLIIADAAKEEDAFAAVAKALTHNGRLDVAINNVGNLGDGDRWDRPLHETPLDIWDNTMRQSLSTSMLAMKAALPPMMAQSSGAIVNVSALAGMRVTRFASPAYSAAKAGLIHLTRRAALAYAPMGIRINCVAPGLTLTSGLQALDQADQDMIANELHPSGRPVTTEEVADAILWAASDRSSSVVGHVIPVDGGWAAL
jgi:NAD(P)-dependent dehydrogenase (short-subunit alcohol dehydrogenase family)